MPAEIINLRRARKAKARDAKARQAEENRARFGRTKAERTSTEAETERSTRHIEGHRRRDPEDPGNGGSGP